MCPRCEGATSLRTVDTGGMEFYECDSCGAFQCLMCAEWLARGVGHNRLKKAESGHGFVTLEQCEPYYRPRVTLIDGIALTSAEVRAWAAETTALVEFDSAMHWARGEALPPYTREMLEYETERVLDKIANFHICPSCKTEWRCSCGAGVYELRCRNCMRKVALCCPRCPCSEHTRPWCEYCPCENGSGRTSLVDGRRASER